ncbi:protein unc-93 homolog A-like [Spea bombifrons]|uniref:protein unc-93 homolog A-like n=1 Tax=Spea bombifrons TaxID=233779 RepID=UPI00234BF6CF|nr:protein unc-93 homolog A-like [Spea bombifrons]
MEISHLKNIFVIAFGFLLIFIAFGGLQTLQSSLNPYEGMGAISLSVIYGSQIFSSVFITPFAIQKLGCKLTIVIAMCFYIICTLANFYPKWYTLIPTSVMVGLGGSPFWTAKCTYLTLSAKQYAEKMGKVKMHVINQYFGIFFLIFQSSRIWGNLISSLILNFAENEPLKYLNNTNCGSSDFLAILIKTGNTSSSEPMATKSQHFLMYVILGIYTGCGTLAVLLVACFLDPIDLQHKMDKSEPPRNIFTHFLVTLKHLQDKRQWLLIPLTMYSGIEQGFILSDYTQSYVTCSLGIQFVGYVIIIFGATTSICSYFFGKLCQYASRIIFFFLAAVINIISITALFLWKPLSDQLVVFFVFSGLWGIGDAVWQTLVNALYGTLFDDNREAAFANYLLWKSLGYFLSFGYSSFLSINIKLSILLCILVVGMVLYGIVEYTESKKSQFRLHDPIDTKNIDINA